ncbi:MAG: apolipoprotein N-acyltransferase [Candidatus Pelagadaptatus aseana]|uniref:apolipoprotein N-acyltransferase n=1 Tax=Candidatus Pelagadaptatus aseana TaxID=3120508 RepID=UPI0039B18E7C
MLANQHNPQHPTADITFSGLGRWQSLLLSLVAGALLPLSLAPLNLWPLAIISPALLAVISRGRNTLHHCYSFGLGLFGVGASWVYVSIHNFGYASVPLAACLTLLFVAGLALVFALPFYPLRYLKHATNGNFLTAFGALWVLGEWLRSWLLTGFPWLYVGYSQLTTPLSGFAPIGGVFAVSLATLATALALVFIWRGKRRQRLGAVAAVFILWLAGALLQDQNWTAPVGPDQRITLVQPNIPQDKKWRPEYRLPTLELLRHMSQELEGVDWIVWPEAAVPMLYHRASPFLAEMEALLAQHNTALLTGIIYDNPETGHLHNSAVALGQGSGLYHKSRLVPFGEYVPLEDWLRGVIAFFDLPMSAIKSGGEQQPPILMGQVKTGMAICYEIVYPDLVAARATDTHFITTLSNDAWFGHSWGPLQHLQMAQMRALETQRDVIRGTNNGISAIITADGSIALQSRQFEREVVTGKATPRAGSTPFMRWGSLPWVLLCGLLLGLAFLPERKVKSFEPLV